MGTKACIRTHFNQQQLESLLEEDLVDYLDYEMDTEEHFEVIPKEKGRYELVTKYDGLGHFSLIISIVGDGQGSALNFESSFKWLALFKSFLFCFGFGFLFLIISAVILPSYTLFPGICSEELIVEICSTIGAIGFMCFFMIYYFGLMALIYSLPELFLRRRLKIKRAIAELVEGDLLSIDESKELVKKIAE